MPCHDGAYAMPCHDGGPYDLPCHDGAYAMPWLYLHLAHVPHTWLILLLHSAASILDCFYTQAHAESSAQFTDTSAQLTDTGHN